MLPFLCYYRRSNPKIRAYVQQHLKGDFRALESEFVQKLLNIIGSLPTENGYMGEYKNKG